MSIIHGALDYAELERLGLDPAGVCDFSSNLNPFGPPDAARAALAALDPSPYPDRECLLLRRALVERHACSPERILPGNGANELIHLIPRALLRPGERALVAGPSFGEYAHASELAGARVVEWRAREQEGFAIEAKRLLAAVRRERPRLTWVCAPNNPTGAGLGEDALAALAGACAEVDGLLVIDRAYAAFLREHIAYDGAAQPHVLTLHSLTKSYGLAGLRLGYLLADPALIARVARYQPAWSVSSAAQAAGVAALGDRSFLATSVPELWAASDTLAAELRCLDLHVHRAALPFQLVRTGDGAATRAALLRRGLVVRDCASFGLPAWVRVAPRLPDENMRLVAAWRAILNG